MSLSLPYHLENYIDGYLIGPLSGRFTENVNPATGEVYCLTPDSNEKDIELAVHAARKAFPSWSKTSADERFNILLNIAKGIEDAKEMLALAETQDTGKPLWLSRQVDIPRASANFRFFASAIKHDASEAHATDTVALNYTLRQPLGVVACISPWNLPLYLLTWKIAPALAAGNCVVAKPSEVTPVTAFLLSRICREAGLPPGVLNIVHGTGVSAGEALVAHPEVKAISFTGSTKTGARIASLTAGQFKKLSLEMGGKNPSLIFADCNWETMLQETIRSSFSNQGEICLCTSRILVEASVYEKFREEFVQRVKQLSVGDPLDENNYVGAIVSKIHYEKILRAIETAKKEGATVLCGGEAVHPQGRCANGYFITPTVLEGLGPECETNRIEIFGPVVKLQSFRDETEALQLANASGYGLAATVWTQHLTRAHRIAGQLECGIVWINCWMLRDLRTPFGGMKQSGLGREGGWEALRFFTEAKNVCIRL
ncbi:MAG: aldehyde dehydrogenase [Chitinophagaceae bacterium]|nr:aldehyde dehydrogenase [Chitinophagaceae bacterium]